MPPSLFENIHYLLLSSDWDWDWAWAWDWGPRFGTGIWDWDWGLGTATVGKFRGWPYKKSDWSSYLLIGHRGLWLDIISSDWLSWPLIGHHVLWLVISHYVNHIHHVLISFSHSHFLIFSFYIDTRRYCQVTGTGIRDGKWEMGNGK